MGYFRCGRCVLWRRPAVCTGIGGVGEGQEQNVGLMMLLLLLPLPLPPPCDTTIQNEGGGGVKMWVVMNPKSVSRVTETHSDRTKHKITPNRS